MYNIYTKSLYLGVSVAFAIVMSSLIIASHKTNFIINFNQYGEGYFELILSILYLIATIGILIRFLIKREL